MRNVRCPRCKQLYEFEGLPPKFCPTCSESEYAKYSAVREFVKAHQGVSIDVVMEHTGIPRHKILEYIREEKLSISPGSNSYMRCKKCGRIIYTGEYCEECWRESRRPPSTTRIGLKLK